jgi:hypothetical protein
MGLDLKIRHKMEAAVILGSKSGKNKSGAVSSATHSLYDDILWSHCFALANRKNEVIF